MECRILDIVIKSAKDLKDVNLVSKMDVYAIVKIDGDQNLKSSKQQTPVDKDCGPNPKWDFPLKFTIDNAAALQNRLTLVIKIKSDRTLVADKEIGEIHVPIRELLDSFGDAKEAKHVTYSVRTPSGKMKGTLELSYRFGEKFTSADHKNKQGASKDGYPVMAYPAGSAAGCSGSGYPPPGAYPPPQYAAPPPASGYPQAAPAYGAYPPGGYSGYPQYPPPGGYPPPGAYPQQQGYGYGGYGAPVQNPQKPKKGGMGGGGLALGVGAGLLGGLLIGEAIDDVSDAGFDDGGGFDF